MLDQHIRLTPRMTFLVVAASLACWSLPDAVPAQTGMRVTAPEHHLHDDFSTDTRGQYGIHGLVEWKKGQLAIGEGAELSRQIEPGHFVEFDVHLEPAVKPEGHPLWEFEIRFNLDSGRTVAVSLARRSTDGNTVDDIQLLEYPRNGKPRQLRRFAGPDNLSLRPLHVSFRAGVLRVGDADNPAAAGYSGDDTRRVREVSLSSREGILQCSELSLVRNALSNDQSASLEEVLRLNADSVRLNERGKPKEALPLAERAQEIQRTILGSKHPMYALCTNNVAGIYWSMEEYAKAEPLFMEAFEIRKKVLGEQHPDYANSLNNLAALYKSMGAYTKAEPFDLEATKIRKETVGERHPSYALSLNNLAYLYHRMGKYEKAEPLYLQALEIWRAAGWQEHPYFTHGLNNLAGLYESTGAYAKSETLFVQALDIRKKIFGEDHPKYAASLGGLASLYASRGEYKKAESFFMSALEIKKKSLGEEHRDYAASLNSLAILYEDMGDYGRAETLHVQATAISKKTLGEEHPYYAAGLNNLATLYVRMGAYAKAEPLHLRAHEIIREVLGEEHPQLAASLINMARMYEKMGAHAKAESLYRQAVDIFGKAVGEEHPEFATSLNNLAYLYNKTGAYAKADPLFLRALEIRKKTLGAEHPHYAISLNNCALTYLRRRNYAEAERFFLQALEVRKRTLGEEHPSYAASLDNLAGLRFRMGDFAEAENLYRQQLEALLFVASDVGRWLPEARARALTEELDAGPKALLSAMRYQNDPDHRAAYHAAWNTRALVTRVVARRSAMLQDTPGAKRRLQELQDTSQQLAQLTLAVAGPELRELRRQRLRQLHARKQAIESKLAEISVEFRRQTEIEEARVQDLVALLDRQTAVIDLINPSQWDAPQEGRRFQSRKHYEGFVVKSSEEPPGYTVAWIHLGLEGPINRAIAAWRAELTSGSLPAVGQASGPPVGERGSSLQQSSQLLRELLWDKIEPHLVGCTKIVIVADGDLHFLPWVALPGRKPGTYLIEDYAISTAPYGQQLYAALTDACNPGRGTLLVGGVAYDNHPVPLERELLAGASMPRSQAPALGRRVTWPHLPGSTAEIRAITAVGERTTNNPTIFNGTEANEIRLRLAMPGRQTIHLATHGFFADESFRSSAGHDIEGEQLIAPDSGLVSAEHSRVTSYNPMILSGVVLAGANLPPKSDSLGLPSGEDGILTAEEIVGLDLRGTDLVVLSACDTGLGRVAGGEGVMGLTRAFHMAGAKTVVASLWKVEDNSTQELMTRFYRNLWEKKLGKLEALRQAQLSMLHDLEDSIVSSDSVADRGPNFSDPVKIEPSSPDRRPMRTDPRKWAAFFLSGAP